MENDYYSIAISDIRYINSVAGIEQDNYNNVIVQCQQAIEKLLKSIVEDVSTNKEILRSHNLVNLYEEVTSYGVEINIDMLMLYKLSNSYFNCRYPSCNYKNTTKDDLLNAIESVNCILYSVNEYRKRFEKYTLELTIERTEEKGIDAVFNAYRHKYNIVRDKEWFDEMYRLSTIAKSADLKDIAKLIEQTFL